MRRAVIAGLALAAALAGALGGAAPAQAADTARCRAETAGGAPGGSPSGTPGGAPNGTLGADGFCEVAGGRLHFVDWGGQGPPLILLAGFGDSARIFEELAPLLAAERRVYALTRRGFGRSEAGSADVHAERFAADVVAMMDALGVAQADLVGHSVAGAEMVLVARDHPERVRRLVYLDAAYDRSQAVALEAGEPTPRMPPPAALASHAAYAAWRSASIGTRSPAVAANAREVMRLEPAGLRPATPGARMAAIAGGGLLAVPPDYRAIAAPQLAIYAPKDQPEQIPPEASPEQRAAARAYALRRVRPWMLREQAHFLETAPCGVAMEPAWAAHYLFLQRPAWTAATIAGFLDAPAPCTWTPPAP